MSNQELVCELKTEIGLKLSNEQLCYLEKLDALTATIVKELINDTYEKAFDDAGRELCGG